MRTIREMLGLSPHLSGLESILDQVAAGELSTSSAAEQIRTLATQPHIPPWFPRVFRVMGCIFTLIGIGFGCYSVVFAIGTEEGQGTVTKMIGGSPVVDYAVNGRQFSFQSPISSSPPAYAPGDKVNVIYHPDNPASAQINSFHERWLFPLAFTAGGAWSIICSYLFPRWISFLTGADNVMNPSKPSAH